MNNGASALFRDEAIRFRSERLQGNVSLATPLRWQIIGFLMLAALTTAIGFLAIGSYARIEAVPGAVALDTGVATILPSRGGVIAALMVHEGQTVRAGEVLARVRSEEDMIDGATAPDRIRAALGEQDLRLLAQGRLLEEAADAEEARLRAQVAGIEEELIGLDAQIADQRLLLATAEREHRDVQRVAANGFISRRDLEAREATVVLRRQQLAQYLQSRAAKRANLAEARRTILQSAAVAEAQVADTQSSRAALLQRITEADLARGYAVTAPVAGTVTALTARIGQRAGGEQPMMTIVPSNARARVELYIPTAAAGFVAPGQSVRLAVDAFPYQRFGTITARIREIAGAPIVRNGPSGPVPMYLAVAELPAASVRAFGRDQPLLPGMTLTARIVTERRSLLEWLFEPIFAVRRR